MSAFPPHAGGRWVIIHLTPFVVDAGVGDRARWIHRGNTTPANAVRGLLDRLGRTPGAISVQTQRMGDVAIFSAGPGERVLPLAFVVDGLTEAEIVEALNGLEPQSGRSSENSTLKSGGAAA